MAKESELILVQSEVVTAFEERSGVQEVFACHHDQNLAIQVLPLRFLFIMGDHLYPDELLDY